MLKVLQVWADWFLFSDAYVNGLRATFLRPGNSGVAPFHTLYGDALAGKENGIPTDGEPGLYVGEGSDTGQDAALAIGEGAAARELANLPFAELERRCRHNGLSTRGGREVMVARLLSLEEAEKQKNHEPEDDSKAGQGYSLHNKGVAVKDGDGMFRMRGEGRWGAGGGWTEVGTGWREISRDERDKIEVGENGDGLREDRRQGLALEITTGLGVQWPRYEEDEDVDSTVRASREGRSGPGSSRTGTLPSTLALPQPELKVFSSKPEKVDPVLPASKWTREDEASDEDEKPDRRGLGLEYSSSGSDDLYGGTPKPDKQDSRVDIIAGAANDTSMDEERRLVFIQEFCQLLFDTLYMPNEFRLATRALAFVEVSGVMRENEQVGLRFDHFLVPPLSTDPSGSCFSFISRSCMQAKAAEARSICDGVQRIFRRTRFEKL